MGSLVQKKKDKKEKKDKDKRHDHKDHVIASKVYREGVLHEGNNGGTVTVKVLGEVIVALDEVLEDGLKWMVKESPALKSFDESKRAIDAETQERVFRFEPKEKGVLKLVLAYRNPWKVTEPDVKKVTFTIVAE